MKKKSTYNRMRPKVIALVVEGALMMTLIILAFIFSSLGHPINIIVILVIGGVLMIAILATLSSLRYDAMRDIRQSDVNKDNLPIYMDITTQIGHDIKEEESKERRGD